MEYTSGERLPTTSTTVDIPTDENNSNNNNNNNNNVFAQPVRRVKKRIFGKSRSHAELKTKPKTPKSPTGPLSPLFSLRREKTDPSLKRTNSEKTRRRGLGSSSSEDERNKESVESVEGIGLEGGANMVSVKDSTGRKLALVVESDQVRSQLARQLEEDMRRQYLKDFQIL